MRDALETKFPDEGPALAAQFKNEQNVDRLKFPIARQYSPSRPTTSARMTLARLCKPFPTAPSVVD